MPPTAEAEPDPTPQAWPDVLLPRLQEERAHAAKLQVEQ